MTSITPRIASFDMIIPLQSNFVDSQTVIVNKVTIDQTTKIDINLEDTDFKNLFKVQSLGSSGVYSDKDQLLINLKNFFNKKTNLKLFSDRLYEILITKYSNIYINMRKLKNLCKGEGKIWNEIFLSKTIFKDPNNLERETDAYEEIALDFANMVEQDESTENADIDFFWDNLVTGDNVTLVFTLNMSNFSSTNSSINIFVKFNVLNGLDAYNFSL